MVGGRWFDRVHVVLDEDIGGWQLFDDEGWPIDDQIYATQQEAEAAAERYLLEDEAAADEEQDE